MKNIIKYIVPIAFPLLVMNIQAWAQTTTKNYLLTDKVLVSGQTTESAVNSLAYTQKQIQTVYLDGLGRPIQTNNYKASHDGSQDIITARKYDAFGRIEKEFIPYSFASNKSYDSNFQSYSRYTSDYNDTDDKYAFYETIYEASPLNRLVKQAAPGHDWRNGSGKESEVQYGTNSSSEVRNYTVGIGGTLNLSASNYAVNTLYKTTFYDEDDRKTEEFADKLGNVVLMRRWNGATQYSTYYVYDLHYRLAYVIPPKATADDGSISSDELDQLCYQYQYDHRNRMIKKRIPGSDDFTYLIYDNLDRLVLTQDKKLRNVNSNKYNYIKYDSFSRPVEKGICTENKSYSTLVSTVGASNNYTPYGCSALVRIHYDDYSVANWHIYATVYAEHTKVTNVKGRVTGVETKMLESGTWIRSLNYYDKFGRLLQTFRGNPEGGYNRISFAYDFAGNNTKKQTYHKKTSGSTAITVNEQFDHDHMGRPTFVKHGYNTSTLTTIAKYTYDDIGRTDIKELHQGYQDLDMQFNIRGWLTQMNDPDVSASNAKLFAFELYYNTVDEISPLDEDGQFNGNVSGIRWRNNNSTRAAYAFKYDGLNRLTKADYGSGTSGGTITDYDKYEVDVSYDANGNISALTRENSSGGILDAFTYVYSGNRLSSLSGSSSYGYDGNGNTTYDGKRGIGVGYFEEIDMPGHYARGTDTVRYEYDATGLKWGKSATLGGNTSTMDYYGEFIYRDGTLDKVLTSEGYYDPTGADYHYHLKDHLGNTRMTIHYDGSSATAQVDQEIEYYPFGKMFSANNTAENKYLYNGKELQNEFFENYDYGARFYDPELGRFHTQDRFAEKYFPLSPYQYAANNPVYNIDVNGDSIWVSVVNTTTDANGNTNTTKTGYYYGQDANGNYGFLDASGNIYSGNDKFVRQLTTASSDLRQGGAAGAGLVNDLMTSTNNTEVVSRGVNKADSQNGAYILWNPTGTNGGPDQNGGNTRPSFIGLGHEMAHVQDVWNGTINNNPWVTVTLPNGQTQSIPYAEIYSTHMENQIRSENNVPLRVSYGINAAGGADPSARIIRAGTSQSIYYNQNGVTNYSPLKRKQTPFTY